MAGPEIPGSVVVTGAGSGIGFATVEALLAAGNHVLAWDRDAGRLSGLRHDRLAFDTIDVRDRIAMDRVLAGSAGAHPPVVGLVTCAAIFNRKPFLELDEASWDAHFAVNLKGSLLACQAVLPGMRRRRAGSIVLMSSTLARTGSPTGAHYAATKGGILGLARSLSRELAREGIRVNVVSPGLADTPQPRGHGPEEDLMARARRLPMGRMAQPREIADAVLFLLGPDSSFVTGQDLAVNGGLL
jgi:NAD(P)-dependent dehydrogenase (short-subunit alcohol dehydrogenase family)